MEKTALPKLFSYPVAFLFLITCAATLVGYPIFIALDGALPLESVINKTALLFLTITVYPLAKAFQYSTNDLGFNAPIATLWKKGLYGFLLGLLILAAAIAVEIQLEIHQFVDFSLLSIELFTTLLLKALFIGLIIALIEETLFRGLLFKFIQVRANPFIAIVLSALFFAFLRFLKSGLPAEQPNASLLNGFEIVAFSFANLINPEIVDSFLALFLVGLFLAIIRNKTGSIAHCIGLHASWVFLIMVSKRLTETNSQSEWFFWLDATMALSVI
jgi:membrane protease YdiL (CAAX protease family)